MAEDNCKRELINICCKYLSNAWKEVKFDEITCKELSGGFANRTYYCSIKSSQIPEKYLNVEPKEVVIHLNGAGICGSIHSLGYKTIGEVALNVAIEILSRINMAPKLYVVFEGGRIEEYVPVI
ncbi:ethanolamine kinase-like protein [Dinothrombium tinctorium]|uniref:Ethanolamine kinase-like protein n=1 Tax=Dinothrombium tinctorium TaxID=1965070 RepID=A0A3S3PFX4_9ACAR|nr:ethanolamine kinase-like protein [Dinothrombium tinctorium]